VVVFKEKKPQIQKKNTRRLPDL